jgi:hypothetical protein
VRYWLAELGSLVLVAAGVALALFGLASNSYGAPCTASQCTHPASDFITYTGVGLAVVGLVAAIAAGGAIWVRRSRGTRER